MLIFLRFLINQEKHTGYLSFFHEFLAISLDLFAESRDLFEFVRFKSWGHFKNHDLEKKMCVCVRGIHQKKDINILWGLFFVLVSFYQQKWIDRSCAPKNTYPKLFHEAHCDFKRNHSKFPKLQELDYHIKKTYPPPPEV